MRQQDQQMFGAEQEQVGRLGEAARQEVLQDLELDDLDVRPQERTKPKVAKGRSSRLQEAREQGERMRVALQDICRGLEDKYAAIAETVNASFGYHGSERLWAGLGHMGFDGAMAHARKLREERLQNQNIKELVEEVNRFALDTIEGLGETERAWDVDAAAYSSTLKYVLGKLTDAQPKLARTRADREGLQARVRELKLELDSGVEEGRRAEVESQYEKAQRDLQAAVLQETVLAEKVTSAQRAIPALQQNRDAAVQSLTATRQMRQHILETQQNFEIVLKNAMTGVRAQARLEQFQDADPALNRTVMEITSHNLSVAAAAVDLLVERTGKTPIDPRTSAEFSKRLSEVADQLDRQVAALNEESRRGSRPLANGEDTQT